MDIRNRMADVRKLRCNACQEFLKMVLCNNWRESLYNIAKNEIDGHGRYADNYRPMYEKMREVGIDNYNVEDMDVSFITQVVCFCPSVVNVSGSVKETLKRLRDDRNQSNHSGENEDEEELYLMGLLALCDLRYFVKAVDKEEKIDDSSRLTYRKKYIQEIEKLKDTLDEERIQLVQRQKDIEKDINRLLDCKDDVTRLELWIQIFKAYTDRHWLINKDPETSCNFAIKASDAGIHEAHYHAAIYYQYITKDYAEMERRLFMLLKCKEKLDSLDARNIVDCVNKYISDGNKLTPGMREMIEEISKHGYPVEETAEGMISWN